MTPSNGIRERLGDAIGGLWAPIAGGISRLRHARMFHPEGLVFTGELEVIPGSEYEVFANQLGRTVLARLSGALRRGGRESLDVLGIALRMHRGHKLKHAAVATDQDLLFATIRSPLTMALSPFTTRSHDFFANRYFAVSPFALEGMHRVELRLSPITRPNHPGTRAEKLRAAVDAGEARFVLEARKTLHLGWVPIANISLTKEIEIDQEALHFDPFQNGAGIIPVGVIHAIRKRVYAASRAARPHTEDQAEHDRAAS